MMTLFLVSCGADELHLESELEGWVIVSATASVELDMIAKFDSVAGMDFRSTDLFFLASAEEAEAEAPSFRLERLGGSESADTLDGQSEGTASRGFLLAPECPDTCTIPLSVEILSDSAVGVRVDWVASAHADGLARGGFQRSGEGAPSVDLEVVLGAVSK